MWISIRIAIRISWICKIIQRIIFWIIGRFFMNLLVIFYFISYFLFFYFFFLSEVPLIIVPMEPSTGNSPWIHDKKTIFWNTYLIDSDSNFIFISYSLFYFFIFIYFLIKNIFLNKERWKSMISCLHSFFFYLIHGIVLFKNIIIYYINYNIGEMAEWLKA